MILPKIPTGMQSLTHQLRPLQIATQHSIADEDLKEPQNFFSGASKPPMARHGGDSLLIRGEVPVKQSGTVAATLAEKRGWKIHWDFWGRRKIASTALALKNARQRWWQVWQVPWNNWSRDGLCLWSGAIPVDCQHDAPMWEPLWKHIYPHWVRCSPTL